jgi:hypothetical protein
MTALMLLAFVASHVSALPLPFKIFGVGLTATGTDELYALLDQFPDMRLVIRDAAFIPFLFNFSTSVPYRFHEKYRNADAVLDVPTALYFREMLHVYPTARFILTTRGMEKWRKSITKHLAEIEAHYDGFIPYRIKALLLQGGFLFAFDLTMALLNVNLSNKLFDSLTFTPVGVSGTV